MDACLAPTRNFPKAWEELEPRSVPRFSLGVNFFHKKVYDLFSRRPTHTA